MDQRLQAAVLALVVGAACAAQTAEPPSASGAPPSVAERAPAMGDMIRELLNPAGVKQVKDVVYATVPGEKGAAGVKLRLDLYLPEKRDDATALPLVIWIHGGGWQSGSKAMCPAASFAKNGFVVASIQYRLTDAATWPAQIHDCKAAVRFLRANAKEYGIDPDRIGVWGASAGGHLASLLGQTADDKQMNGTLGEHAAVSSAVQAVCNWFGPADLVTLAEYAREDSRSRPGSLTKLVDGSLAEKREVLKSASPVEYADKSNAPMLLMHGTDDVIVPLGQSEALKAALEKAGAQVTMEVLPDSGHGTGRFLNLTTLGKVRGFFEEKLAARVKEATERTSHGE